MRTASANPDPGRPGRPTWVWPLVVVLALLVGLHFSGVSHVLNRSAFDGLQRLQANPDGWADGFVLVLIDETSLKEMSDPALTSRPVRWPWPRDFFAASGGVERFYVGACYGAVRCLGDQQM